eukprot:364197-Chlamydomonas_euryale.AAC.46
MQVWRDRDGHTLALTQPAEDDDASERSREHTMPASASYMHARHAPRRCMQATVHRRRKGRIGHLPLASVILQPSRWVTYTGGHHCRGFSCIFCMIYFRYTESRHPTRLFHQQPVACSWYILNP